MCIQGVRTMDREEMGWMKVHFERSPEERGRKGEMTFYDNNFEKQTRKCRYDI
jgi:hypothetical protein